MKLKSIFLASTFIFVGAMGAHAADAINYHEPAPVISAPVFSWGGAYIGGQVGYGWAKSTLDNYYKVEPSGFIGGLYAGYNFDMSNNVVLGIDGDVTYNNLNAETKQGTETFESRMRLSGAVRARAGYAIDRLMPYIAGGVAFGKIKNAIGSSVIDSAQNKTLTGWTAGAGIDYVATDNVILRLEYRYTDYGKGNYSFYLPNTEFKNEFKTNELRLGVAYKF